MKKLTKLFSNIVFVVCMIIALLLGVFIALSLIGVFDYSLNEMMRWVICAT